MAKLIARSEFAHTLPADKKHQKKLTGYVTPANINGRLFLVQTDKAGKNSFKPEQGREAFAFLNTYLADNPEVANKAFTITWGRDGVPFEDAVYHLHASRYQNVPGFVQCYLSVHRPNEKRVAKAATERKVVFL